MASPERIWRGGRVAALALLAALGCAGRTVPTESINGPYTLEHASAKWGQQLYIGNFDGYAPGEYCVGSDIMELNHVRESTGVQYGMLIRVSMLGTTYVATQEFPDGTETLSIRLRKGEDARSLYADFDHSVQDGARKLRFTGTTLLPIDWGEGLPADWAE
jgi:hypothetical protein